MVFASETPRPARSVPTYLDVALAMDTEGPCFTFPSPLVLALERALDADLDYAPLGCQVRKRLRGVRIDPFVEESLAAPIVTTFSPPQPDFIERCRERGYLIGGESNYLASRGLVQIATMGAVQRHHIDQFFDDVSLQAS